MRTVWFGAGRGPRTVNMQHGRARDEHERTPAESVDALAGAHSRRRQPEWRAEAQQSQAEGLPESRPQVQSQRHSHCW